MAKEDIVQSPDGAVMTLRLGLTQQDSPKDETNKHESA